MSNLADYELKSLLPYSISGDAEIRNICDAIKGKLREIDADAGLLLLLPRLDELSETLVDELAWQYHVDYYTPAIDLPTKRNLVRNAILQHRIKGTPAAVEEVCRVVFKSAVVYENWEYGGKPYHFQVRLITEGIPDTTVIDKLTQAIYSAKNTRSWCDGMSFYREIYGDIYYGLLPVLHRVVSIYPAMYRQPDIKGTSYFSGPQNIFKRVVIR